jgi:hypothetical protein
MRQREGRRGTPEAIARPELRLILKRAAAPARVGERPRIERARAWSREGRRTMHGESRGRVHRLEAGRGRPLGGAARGQAWTVATWRPAGTLPSARARRHNGVSQLRRASRRGAGLSRRTLLEASKRT